MCFSAMIEPVCELFISYMHNTFEQGTGKLWKSSRPQGKIIDAKCKQLQQF